MTTKSFHLGDILSVTTGILVSPDHMGGVYKILNFMTGENLFTHQLPRVCNEAKPILIKQHPWLAEVTGEGITGDNWKPWLDGLVAAHGEFLSVSPMNRDEHERIDPISELAEKIHPDNIITINT